MGMYMPCRLLKFIGLTPLAGYYINKGKSILPVEQPRSCLVSRSATAQTFGFLLKNNSMKQVQDDRAHQNQNNTCDLNLAKPLLEKEITQHRRYTA